MYYPSQMLPFHRATIKIEGATRSWRICPRVHAIHIINCRIHRRYVGEDKVQELRELTFQVDGMFKLVTVVYFLNDTIDL
jgi:hypothetical protein